MRRTAAVVMLAAIAGCSSGGHPAPQVVRITDPHVAKSPLASQFVTDLYTAAHGGYWRTRDQNTLLLTASIYCSERATPTGLQDLRGDFTGLGSSGIAEFASVAKKDLCDSIDKTGKVPGY